MGLLKLPLISVFIIGLLFGAILYTFQYYWIAEYLIIVILAFLMSDIVSALLIRGGGGIFQIRPLGTQTQPKGYAFIAFFISILISAYVVNVLTRQFVDIISPLFKEFTADLGIGLILAALVYLAMLSKYYVR